MLYCIDLQSFAIARTREKLQQSLSVAQLSRVHFYNQSHCSFPVALGPASASAVVYNLGYLPGGDKSVTTSPSSTEASLRLASAIVRPGGGLVVTCYRGHRGGPEEAEGVARVLKSLSLSTENWAVTSYSNTANLEAPVLYLATKIK